MRAARRMAGVLPMLLACAALAALLVLLVLATYGAARAADERADAREAARVARVEACRAAVLSEAGAEARDGYAAVAGVIGWCAVAQEAAR